MNPAVRYHLFRHPQRIPIRLSESRVQPPLNIGLDFLRSVSSGPKITSLGNGKLGSQLIERKESRENVDRKEMEGERITADGRGKKGRDIKQYLSHIERTATEPRDEVCKSHLHMFQTTHLLFKLLSFEFRGPPPNRKKSFEY